MPRDHGEFRRWWFATAKQTWHESAFPEDEHPTPIALKLAGEPGKPRLSMARASKSFIVERLLPWAVLAILLLYTYARFFEHPYTGLRWDTSGTVVEVFVQGNPSDPILVGDRVIQLGTQRLADVEADYSRHFANTLPAGQTVPVIIERGGQQIVIPWRLPGLNRAEFLDQAISEIWLAYVFWGLGALAATSLRPRGSHWALALAFNFLTAVWLAAGGGASFYHVWYSAYVLRIAVWFCVPVYLHFHWSLPTSLAKPVPSLQILGYAGAGVLALAECFQLLPHEAYFVGFLLALVGSLVLLIARAIWHPVSRPGVSRMFVLLAVGLAPLLIIPIMGPPVTGLLASILGLTCLPFIPIAYFYWAFRQQLGPLELRVNRVIATYAYLALLAAIELPLIAYASVTSPYPTTGLLIGASVGLFTALVSIWGFPAFKSLIEDRLLRIRLPLANLLSEYASRLPTCTSLPQLAALLEHDIMPSLLVRQLAFLHIEGGQTRVVLAMGVGEPDLPHDAAVPQLASIAGVFRPVDPSNSMPFPWIRLAVPLKLGESLIGLWLFGRRDPDDVYSHFEIPIIQSLANQTAVVLSNMVHTERLRSLYQADVNRHEEDRLRLALKLHDTVLNQLAAALMKLDASSPMSDVQSSYEELANLVRGIATDLRPPMLAYGLKAAIEELAEDQMARSGKSVRIRVDLVSDETRYPPQVELYVFRIVQESVENAVRHAEAETVAVSGRLDPARLEIHIHDDGTGFEVPGAMALEALIARKHFGLAGLLERAGLIGAELRIDSAPGHGTDVSLRWQQPRE